MPETYSTSNGMNLNEYLLDARKASQAIGHFNFATADVLRAIIEGSKEAGALAVMAGTSEGEAEFLGLREAVALVRALREDLQYPVFLNADHFKSIDACKRALDAGYDTVLFDGSKLSYNENIAATKAVKNYADERPVEGEIGYLRGLSEIQEKVQISPEDYTKPEQAKEFVEQTGVSRLAVVFGNIHGIVTVQEEKLDVKHLKRIMESIPDTPIVLHGASGLLDEQVSLAIKAGVANVHFNTELRVTYAEGIEKAIHVGNQDSLVKKIETTPYKYLGPAAKEVKELVMKKTLLFLGRL